MEAGTARCPRGLPARREMEAGTARSPPGGKRNCFAADLRLRRNSFNCIALYFNDKKTLTFLTKYAMIGTAGSIADLRCGQNGKIRTTIFYK